MFQFLHKFIYWTLSIQEKVLRKKLKRTLKKSFSHSTNKLVFSGGNSLQLTTKTEKNQEKLKQEVAELLKKYGNNPEKLLKFIQKQGTLVYKIPFAHKILQAINYEEGLIGELQGIKAVYISLIASFLSGKGIKISFSTKPMFILRDLPLDTYYMIQQFHKWYAMRLDLPGFDAESQENFQKFLYTTTDEDIKSLTLDEIIGLKEAIARDKEAIDFVVNLAKASSGAKKAHGMITTGGASI